MWRTRLTLVALVILVAGCHSWGAVRAPANPGGATQLGSALVILTDSSRVRMRNVSLTKDSVAGTVEGRAEPSRQSIASAQVARVEVRRFSGGKTALLTIGVLALAFVALIVAALGTGGAGY